MRMKGIITLFIILLAQGCFEDIPINDVETSTSSSTTDDDDSDDDSDFTDVFWYSRPLNVNFLDLTINSNNEKFYYLFGEQVDEYLEQDTNLSEQYCMRIAFNPPLGKSVKPLWIKVDGGQTFVSEISERQRYLRLNLASSDGNDFCLLATTDGDSAPAAASVALTTDDVCSDCTGFLNSTSFKLYQYQSSSGLLDPIADSTVRLSDLSVRLNMNDNSTSESSSCSDSSCVSLGFDCCVQGQCVNEKQVIDSGVASDPTGYILAEIEKANDPNWFIKYPQFYHICSEIPHQDPDETLDPEDPISEAEIRFLELKADYECVTELISNADVDPFHTDPYNLLATYTSCDMTDSTATLYYESVMKRLYLNCGCAEKDDLSIMVDKCPAYTYSPVYVKDSKGQDTTEIESIVCTAPEVETTTPFQDIDVPLNSRTAPHRFFNTDGVEINPYDPLPDSLTNTTQEGDTFEYYDSTKLLPNNGSYNMNSILGQMNVELSLARPALEIDVDADQTYYLAALSGYYTPCPSCGKDSWFSGFAANPASSSGLGTRASGYSTTRTTYGTNISGGNYEDMISQNTTNSDL